MSYGRERLLATLWYALLVVVGLFEVLSPKFRVASFPIGPLGSTWVGLVAFGAGAIYGGAVIWRADNGIRAWKFVELREPPPHSIVENQARTVLRVVTYTWPFLFGIVVGLAFPLVGGFGGGGALAAAVWSAWHVERLQHTERRRGRLWRLAPQQFGLRPKGVPESGYYRSVAREAQRPRRA